MRLAQNPGQVTRRSKERKRALGFKEEPDDFARLVIVRFVSRPVMIDQPRDMAAMLTAG